MAEPATEQTRRAKPTRQAGALAVASAFLPKFVRGLPNKRSDRKKAPTIYENWGFAQVEW
jgi:hypothetical protein